MRILTLPEILAEELAELKQNRPNIFAANALTYLNLAIAVLLNKQTRTDQEALNHLPNHATWRTYLCTN